MSTIKRFWMVVRLEHTHDNTPVGSASPWGTGPKLRHSTITSAQREAKRLAKLTRGTYVVLKAVAVYKNEPRNDDLIVRSPT